MFANRRRRSRLERFEERRLLAFDPVEVAKLLASDDHDGDVDGQDYGQFGLRFLTSRI